MTTKTTQKPFKGALCAALAALLAISLLPIIAVAKPPAPESSIVQPALANPPAAKGDAPAKAEADLEPQVAEPPPMFSPNLITVTTYPFSTATGVVLDDMSTGTTQLIGASSDDGISAIANIGFEYWYDGVRFTQFGVNANGFARLGVIPTGSSFDNTVFNSTTNAPKIAPFWDDLCTGSTGKVHFKVVGSAPSRKLVVEWQNMQITRGAGCAGVGGGTFQMWLSETTGLITFVYGPGMVATAAADAGYSVGLQSGAATNFASVTTATNTVSYAAANNAQTDAITAGRSYAFTPNVPVAPTGLSFTAVTAASMTLNWADNASNEFGYVIYQSTDGTNFTFVTQTAANATSQAITSLSPSTTYFFRIFAVSEGALSTVLAGSQATAAPGNVTSAASGNWSAGATWVGGVPPTAGDNVTIATGHTVTIDSSNALNLTIQSGGVLEFEATTARTLTVGQAVTINSGGTFQTAATGTQTGHILSVGSNLTNNGVLDFSTNANTAGANITFVGAASNTFGGTGATTDVRAITINKGVSSANILELNPTNFTVQGVNTDVAGYLVLTNGTFKISGTFTMANRTFTTATYNIPATGGIWINNANYTVSPTASGTATNNNGLLRMTAGTYNIGLTGADGMGGGTGATFTVEGGTINAVRIDPQNPVTWTQSAGTVNAGVLASNTRSNFGTFELFSTTATFTMSGGTINLINPALAATKVDYRMNAPLATTNITGGTVVVGGTGAPASSTYNVSGTTPSVTVNATHTMGVLAATLFMRGNALLNNGAITSTALTSRLDFGSQNSAMTYSGPGTFGTLAAPFAGVTGGISANSTFFTTLSSPIVTLRVNLFQGGFINSGQITLGNAGASQTVVQTGSTGLTTPGGNFDVSPVHNQGTGGEVLVYAFETAPRTTGVEINPTRILANIANVDNPSGVTIAGGDLTLSATGSALVLTSGRLITGANNLILSSGTATVSRTTGFVDGNFRKNFAAAANKTFEVGTANGYSPVAINATAGTFPTDITAKAIQGAAPYVSSTAQLQRWWTLTGAAITGADLTFNYLASDVVGTVANYQFYKRTGVTVTTLPPTGVPTTTQAVINGVTSLSDWTLADPTAPTPTPTPTPTATPTATATATPTATATATPTATATATPTATATATPTATATATPTATATATPTATATATPTATATATATPTPTATPAGGPVIVTASAGTLGPTIYPTLKDAFDAINAGTHQGTIAVLITGDTTETATASLNNSGAGAAVYTSVSVQPLGGPRTITGSIVGAIIKLNGADNVTIDGRISGAGRNLTVSNSSTSAATAAIWLASVAAGNGASNNVIRNLELACGADQQAVTTVNFGIIQTGTTISVTAADGNDNDNNSFIANRIVRVRYGIASRGVTGNNNIAPIITDNIIGPAAFGPDQIGKIGIYMQGDTGATISRNAIQNIGVLLGNAAGGADRIAIAIGAENWTTTDLVVFEGGDYTVTKNVIHDIVDEKTFSAVGIRLGTTRSGAPTNNLVANNFIYNIRANGTAGDQAMGIGYANGHTDKIVFNSISMTGDMDPVGVATIASQYANAIRLSSPNGTNNANLTLMDNSIYLDVNSNTATVHYYAITVNSSAYVFGTGGLNFNNYFINAANPQLRTGGLATGSGAATTTEFATLANWQGALTAPQDANSIQADPQYASNTADLHIGVASPNNNAGLTIAGVTDDIDGNARGIPPDIGADETGGATPTPTPTPGPTGSPTATPTATATATTTPTATPGCTPATFAGTGVGAIPDGGSGTLPVYGAPLTISFAVAGRTAPLTAVALDLTLNHSWVGDLDMVLTSPGGTASLVTVSRIGVTTANSVGDSSNYSGLYNFTDAAVGTNIWTLATAAACGDTCNVPVGDYRTTAGGTTGQTNPPPVTSLNTTFAGLTTGQINGTWTLTIRDGAAVDTGSVTAANLKLSGACGSRPQRQRTGLPTATPIQATPTATTTPTATPGCTPIDFCRNWSGSDS